MRALAPASLLALLVLAGPAAAQEVSSAAGELAGLEEALTRDEQALSGGECSIACPALGSMDRSAKRLCELEPGERCAKARARVAAAADRVRARCPDCEAARRKPGDEQGAEVTVTGSDRDGEAAEPADAPPREDASRAGCAGCVVGAQPTPAPWLAGALGLLLAIAARRGRARRKR
jgi:MYXO-CTERM domain-containing protein